MVGRKPVTTIQPETKRKLLHVIGKLASHAKTPALGRWKMLSDEELWSHIVSQVCVMGSAVPMEKLHRIGNRFEFESALSLSTLSTKRDKGTSRINSRSSKRPGSGTRPLDAWQPRSPTQASFEALVLCFWRVFRVTALMQRVKSCSSARSFYSSARVSLTS